MAMTNKTPMPGKTVTKKAARAIPKPTGNKLPGKMVSKKAAGPAQPKMLERRVNVRNLASEDPHVAGKRGHMSYKA